MHDGHGDGRVRHGARGGSTADLRRLLDMVERVRDDRLLGALAVLALVALAGVGYLAYAQLRPAAGPPVEALLPRVQLTPTTTPTTTAPVLVVHVVGAVREPGVRQLPAGARILDALAAAGGASEQADLARLNLAAPVTDGAQIRVPLLGEEVVGPLVVGPPTGAGESPEVGPLPLNSATDTQLEALPGVGPATAAAIVAWRDSNGPFTSLDQLLEVRGIGPAKFEALRDLVVLE